MWHTQCSLFLSSIYFLNHDSHFFLPGFDVRYRLNLFRQQLKRWPEGPKTLSRVSHGAETRTPRKHKLFSNCFSGRQGFQKTLLLIQLSRLLFENNCLFSEVRSDISFYHVNSVVSPWHPLCHHNSRCLHISSKKDILEHCS